MKFRKRNIYKPHDHILPNWSKERLVMYFIMTAVVSIMFAFGISDSQKYRTSLLTAEAVRLLLIQAKPLIGKSYELGATGTRKYDCSSLMQKIFKDALGIQLPRISRDQAKVGKRVSSWDDMRAGDLAFFDTFGSGHITHVGLIAGKKDGKLQMLNANSLAMKVKVDQLSGKYWHNTFKTARRINELTKDVKDDEDYEDAPDTPPLPPSEPEPELQDTIKKKSPTKNITFTDISKDYQFKDAVYALAKQNIIKGIGDNKFGPYMYLTRAELLKLLFNTFKTSQIGSKTDFKDIKGHWVEKFVATAMKKGWIKGYPDGTFRPNQTVTRAEGVKIALEVSGLIRRYKNKFNENFSDVSPDSWQKPYASIAKKKRLLSFNGNKFDPNIGLTRGEAAYLIYKTKNTR